MLPAEHNAEDIFAKAIELGDATERELYLESVCAQDAALRAFVDELVESHFAAGDFMNSSAIATIRGGDDDTEGNEDPLDHWQAEVQASIGSFVGPYELLEEIGSGGMAVVYRARQREPRRDVALKLLRPGLQSQQIVSRLARERQLLAMMDHPGIAKVFDAGMSDEGKPFYVMEYVAGQPIASFAKTRDLSLRAKVGLLLQMSRALEHAHQKGIIHRDIKPANLLVSESDTSETNAQAGYRVKVIDFGIAKLTEESNISEPELTRLGQIIGTPQYMSPEQVQDGEKHVDTRSDIYSLGAVLYELLTGRPPVPSAGLIETIQRIANEEPTPPQFANRSVDADLNNICLKCLNKSPAARYQSAGELGQDLQRYLDGRPVLARPVGRMARVVKWARRSPLAATTTAVSAVATTALFVALVIFNNQLSSKQDDLEKRIVLTDAVLAEMHTALKEINVLFKEHTPMGSKLTLAQQRTRLEKGIGMYDTFHQTMTTDPDVDIAPDTLAAIRKERAEIYLEYGKLLLFQDNQTQAAAAYETAIEELRELIESQTGAPAEEADMLRGVALTSLAKVYRELKRPHDAIAACKSSLQIYQRLAGTPTLSADYANWYQAITWGRIANIRQDNGELDAAKKDYRQAELFARKLPGVGDFRLTLSSTLQAMSRIEDDQSQALAFAREAVVLLDSVVLKSMPPLPRYEIARIKATWNLAKIQLATQQSESQESMREAIELQADWAARFPDNEKYVNTLKEMLGTAQMHLSDDEGFSRLEDLQRVIASGEPIPRSAAGRLLDDARKELAEGFQEFKLSKYEEAREHYRNALDHIQSLPKGFQSKLSEEMALGAYLRVGHASFYLADYPAAIEPMRKFLQGQDPQSATERCILAFCIFQSGNTSGEANTTSDELNLLLESLVEMPEDSHGYGLYLPMRLTQMKLAGENTKGWVEKYERMLAADDRDATFYMFSAIGACSQIPRSIRGTQGSEALDFHGKFESWADIAIQLLRRCEQQHGAAFTKRWLTSPNLAILQETPAFREFASQLSQD